MAQAGREVKRAAVAFFALHPNAPVHHMDQAAGDGQAQAGAAESPGERPVHLSERLENHGLLFGGDADAGVAHREVQTASALPTQRSTETETSALVGELDRISDQIDEDLPEPPRIAAHEPRALRNRRRHTRLECPWHRPRLCRPLSDIEDHTRANRGPVISRLSLPASIFEKSRMSLMMVSSDSARAWHQRQILALFGVQLRVQQELGQPDDRRSWACGSRGSCWPGTRSWRDWRLRPPPWRSRAPLRRASAP